MVLRPTLARTALERMLHRTLDRKRADFGGVERAGDAPSEARRAHAFPQLRGGRSILRQSTRSDANE